MRVERSPCGAPSRAGALLALLGLVGPAPPARGEPPLEVDGLALSHPSSIRYAAAEGEFYLADTGNGRVVFLREDLTPRGSVSLRGLSLVPFCAEPAGDGGFWVSDLGRSELVRVLARGDPAESVALGDSIAPGRMRFAPDGRLAVIDRAGRRVLLLRPGSAQDRQVLAVPGSGLLEDLAFPAAGEILVISSSGPAIWRGATAAGSTRWTSHGAHGTGEGNWSFPSGAAADGAGGAWVVDAFRHELRRVDRAGRAVQRFARAGPDPGSLFFPVGVATDASGAAVVLERGAARVQRFERAP